MNKGYWRIRTISLVTQNILASEVSYSMQSSDKDDCKTQDTLSNDVGKKCNSRIVYIS